MPKYHKFTITTTEPLPDHITNQQVGVTVHSLLNRFITVIGGTSKLMPKCEVKLEGTIDAAEPPSAGASPEGIYKKPTMAELLRAGISLQEQLEQFVDQTNIAATVWLVVNNLETRMRGTRIDAPLAKQLGAFKKAINAAGNVPGHNGIKPHDTLKNRKALDRLIRGLKQHHILFTLAEVCTLKAEHLVHSWQEHKSADAWVKVGEHLEVAAQVAQSIGM